MAVCFSHTVYKETHTHLVSGYLKVWLLDYVQTL